MPQSYLIFDFGANEDAAQQARHRLEGWRQAFRLSEKLEYKLERSAPEKKNGPEALRLLVRLDFSSHEQLSHQRWLERIPAEEPFRGAAPKIVRTADPAFASTAERFDRLP